MIQHQDLPHNYRLQHKRQLLLQRSPSCVRSKLISRSSEYKNLRQVVPSLRRQRDVGKVEVVTEAARYIDHLHKTLIERFILCGIPDSLKDILGTDDANQLNSRHIMNLVSSMASNVGRPEEQQQQTSSSSSGSSRMARAGSQASGAVVVVGAANKRRRRRQQQQQQQPANGTSTTPLPIQRTRAPQLPATVSRPSLNVGPAAAVAAATNQRRYKGLLCSPPAPKRQLPTSGAGLRNKSAPQSSKEEPSKQHHD